MNDTREYQLKAVNRLIAAKEAHDSLLSYLQILMPDIEDVEDAKKTRYEATPPARLLCETMEKVERGEIKRVAVSVAPQHGKSQVISRAAPAWFSGRNPYLNAILGSYNSDFATEFGGEVRAIMQSSAHKQVFPRHELLRGGGAKDLLITKEGGKLAFVGVGGSGTGKPADLFIVDDPIRNADDANSQVIRDRIWNWFCSVAFSRIHDKSSIIVVMTRWHVDDLIGRLCDPTHPEREGLYKDVDKGWTYINLPAVVEDEGLAKALGLTLEKQTDKLVVSQFGPQPMSSLWPGRKSLPLLAEAKRLDSRSFNALYMGKPAPDEGEYFKKEWIVEYDAKDLPRNLRKYGASDHAVSAKQRRDYTVLGCVGVDEEDDVWVLPDLVWRRMETDSTVDELLTQFKIHKPALWWMESELISKSFGPFLRKRMLEEQIYVTVDPVIVSKDKETRARAIQGRMSMKKVHFPKFAPWWQNAKTQILTFPYAANDDFVDWLAHIGMGLVKEYRPSQVKPKDDTLAPPGSIKWIMEKSLARARRDKLNKETAGL